MNDPVAPVSRAWGVSWSGIWLGALASVVAVVLFGFVGIAVGAQASGPLNLKHIGFIGLAWAVFAGVLAFAIGGWVSASVAGSVTAESGALHGAGAFLLGIVLLLALGALGAAYVGGWYGAFVPAPSGSTPSAETVRNGALVAAATILFGLMGGVIGGWIASGEGMGWAIATRRWQRD